MSRRSRGTWFGGAMRRLQWLAEAAVFEVCTASISRLSPRSRLAIGSVLGTAFWAVDARHRRAARRNIEVAYGDQLSPRQTRDLALASMRHFARVAVEMLAFRDTEAGIGTVRVEGLDHLRRALAKGRGLLGFSGHFGHWELLRFAAGHHGLPSVAIVRPLDNPYLDRRVTLLRTMGGNGVVAKRGGVSASLKCLRDGGFVTVMVDQRTDSSGMAVPFFGHQAFAADSLAVLALRTGAPIVPGFGFLDTDGSWRVVVEPELPVVPTGDMRADSRRIMTDSTAILERWIRRYPEQWLWTHARLKA
jgi:KDO2-lipid IV(A) lauroyltransferase